MSSVADNVLVSASIPMFSGYVGSFFASGTAAAVGGTMSVLGACGAGAILTCIPAGVLMYVGYECYKNAESSAGETFGMVGMLATAAATVYCSAYFGATLLGVAANPVIFCGLLGLAIILTGALLAYDACHLVEPTIDALKNMCA